MNLDRERFLPAFLEEVDEHVATIEEQLLARGADATSRERIDAIFRAAHSIKGGSGMFGCTELALLTHELETVLDRVRQGQLELNEAVVSATLNAIDATTAMVRAYRQDSQPAPEIAAPVVRELRTLSADGRSFSTAVYRVYDIRYRCSDTGRRAKCYDALLGAVAAAGEILRCEATDTFDVSLKTLASQDEIQELFALVFESGDEFSVGEQGASSAPLERFGFFDTSSDQQDAPTPLRPGSKNGASVPVRVDDNTSIRVALGKVDSLINLVGEIVTAENVLVGALRRSAASVDSRLVEAADKLGRHTRDLRAIVMSIRMVPISHILGRFPRVVRETSGKLGKEVDLRITGGDTELDKGLVERIIDPLTHLVRNAVDHGIEMPDERAARGKPREGRLEIRAAHVSGSIMIDVIDDGGGLSRERIIEKAQLLGIYLPDQPTDKQVWDVIFAPGFSTAGSVTEISGRGVGMDVVRRNVADLGGTIAIDSTAGKGTRVTITLPLTLAILDGLTVLVGEQTYVVPIANVVSLLQPTAAQIKTLMGGAEVVHFGGEWLPLHRLDRIFKVAGAIERPEQGIVAVVETAGSSAAFVVDSVEAQQQLVIKSLDGQIRTPGIAGAAVVDSGKIALILDVLFIVRRQSDDEGAQRLSA